VASRPSRAATHVCVPSFLIMPQSVSHFIPFSHVVLVLCPLEMHPGRHRARHVTTVVIAGALMFCINLGSSAP